MNWYGNCWWTAPVFCLLACCGEGTEGDEILQLDPDAPTVELDIQPSEVETIPMATGPVQNRTDVDNEQSSTLPLSADVELTSPVDVRDQLVQRAFDYLIGTFDSSEQASLNPAYFNVQLTACEVEAPEMGERVLYIEQAMGTNLASPYRQRLYRVSDNGDGRIASEVFTLSDQASYVGLCDRDERVRFLPEQVTLRTGCTVFLTPVGEGFEGGTEGTACSSNLNGAAYATSVVTLGNDRILSWDQGFDAMGNQVWGAEAGPYEFLRLDDPSTAVEAADVAHGTGSMPHDGDWTGSGGETCADAPALVDQSMVIEEEGARYQFRIQSRFSEHDDYNPLQGNRGGLAPACSLVFDARGRDTVFSVFLEPGETIELKAQASPRNTVLGIYFIADCDDPSWPDLDGSGLCGNNEYASPGTCGSGPGCAPIEWQFQWPMAIDGRRTEATQLYLVVDQVGATNGDGFALEWRIF